MPDTSLGRALAELVEDVGAGEELRHRIECRSQRVSRRPKFLAVAAVLVVAALITGALALARDETKPAPVVTRPAPTTTTTIAAGSIAAPTIWPAPTSVGDWRQDPRATAERFATEVLRWRNVRALVDPDTNGFVSVTDGEHQVNVGVSRAAEAQWSVYHAGSPDWPESASVGIDETRAEFHIFGDAAGAVATTITYTRGELVSWVTGPAAKFAPGDLALPGSVLVLAKDAAGYVVGVWATGFKPGAFAAG
jgi:hypothetical protein